MLPCRCSGHELVLPLFSLRCAVACDCTGDAREVLWSILQGRVGLVSTTIYKTVPPIRAIECQPILPPAAQSRISRSEKSTRRTYKRAQTKIIVKQEQQEHTQAGRYWTWLIAVAAQAQSLGAFSLLVLVISSGFAIVRGAIPDYLIWCSPSPRSPVRIFSSSKYQAHLPLITTT